MATKPWSERIPAAIAKGDELMGGAEFFIRRYPNMTRSIRYVLTAGEVALADLAWETFYNSPEYNGERTPVPPALITYCEKVEALP